jgi:hypothetical protein
VSQAAFLAASASGEVGTPIRRGLLIREQLLCQTLPPPPPNVPSIEKIDIRPNASIRERLDVHARTAACAACHRQLDPVGFGLLGFDAIGAPRTKDAWGNPVDLRGRFEGVDAPDFMGPDGLADRLRSSPDLPRCLSSRMLRWILGRPTTDADACLINDVADQFERGGATYGALAQAIAVSDALRFRAKGAEQ